MKHINGKRILVTQPYLPDINKYKSYIDGIYEQCLLTNNGPLVQKLTEQLKEKFNIKHLLLVNNGTTALQVAYKVKWKKPSNIITTPFTFAATLTSLEWEGYSPILADIEKKSWNLCPNQVEALLKKGHINGILPVNIFGMPCDLEALDYLSKKYNTPVIYDSAHALGSLYNQKSIFEFGDIHCISFHATKLFQTIEGGAIIFNNENDYKLAKQLINFGQDENGVVSTPGINGKMSEFHAAMGLCVLDDFDLIVKQRKDRIAKYSTLLKSDITFQRADYSTNPAPIYMPVMLPTSKHLHEAKTSLSNNNINARHYFSPHNLTFLKQHVIPPICNDVASRVLCLPLSNQLNTEDIESIASIVNGVL